MIPVLSVCEVVIRQVGPDVHLALHGIIRRRSIEELTPRYDNFIIHPVELHMLQAPPFIDPSGYISLSQPGQVGRMVHPDLHPVRPKLGDQWRQERGA
jgi:hypothetical protein